METNESGVSRISVKNLHTGYLENPLGIDERRPSLSWQIATSRRNVLQGAYQVQVAQTLGQLREGTGLLWDSGKVASENTVYVLYEGPETQSRRRYYWRVRAWDQDDRPSDWSEPAWWEMGLLDEAEWSADWIEVDWEEDPKAFKPCPFFRSSFELGGPVSSARLYITAHGLYEAWLNGQRVGDQVFAPGYTAYDKRLQYQVYDVTSLLQEGENALGAILGDGWYRGRVYISGNRNVYGTRLGLLAVLRIETTGGSPVTIGTDSKWRASYGPIVKSDMRDGEIYDARLEMPGWCGPGFDDSAWSGVRTANHAKNHLVGSMGVPVRRKETFHPKAILRTPKGEMVLDFGQNLAGVVRMKVRGPRGTTIRLRHGEALDKDGNFTVSHLFVPPPREDKVPPFQEVYYTLKGEGEEEYEPRFTVHGFRYAKVEGYPGEPDVHDFWAVALYSDMPPTGGFTCSDPLINQLHHNVEWSMKGNFLDIPTDCPTRERAGWTGDAQIFSPSASFLMDTRAFFRKWLQDLTLEQFPDGKVGNFVPNPYRLAKGATVPFLRLLDGSSGWGDVAVMMPWALYQAFGDLGILERQYESMKAWVDYEQKQARRVSWSRKLSPRYWFDRSCRARQQYLWDTGYHWGEWLEPGEGSMMAIGTDMIKRLLFGSPGVATAYFANSARILAKIADLLGKAEDAETYGALVEQVKAAYVEEFIGQDGRIEPDKQASYVRVLAFDLAPEELKPAIVGHLVRLVRAADNHIGTGFLSTPFLCHVLSENGRLDVAYDLLNQKTVPSWLYAVTKGATTIWETWEGIGEDGTPQMSLNHYSPGSVVDFLHRKVAGLDAAEPGYRRILIHPMPGGGLTNARATYESVHGLIGSEWAVENGRMRLNVIIPANTRAVVCLPGATAGQVTEGGVPLAQAEGAANPAQIGADTQVEVGSGAYCFEYPMM
jgi:alpha-L-rhamnosidase